VATYSGDDRRNPVRRRMADSVPPESRVRAASGSGRRGSGRPVRAKLRWFVEFLRVFFDSGELEQMAWERLEKYRSAGRTRPEEIENAFAYVLASGADRNRFEDYLRRECAEMEPEWRPYLDLIRRSMDYELRGRSTSDESAHTGQRTELNGLAETEVAVRRAIEIEPDNAENWRNLGRLLVQKGEFTVEAEAALRRGIELDPNSASSWNSLGLLLIAMPQRSSEAEAALRKAIELDSHSASFWTSLSILLVTLPERSDEAEAALRKTTELDPESALSWSLLGCLLIRKPKRSDEAVVALRKALEIDPSNGSLWGLLGFFLACREAKPREAEIALRRSVELEPDSSRPLRNLGVLLYCEILEKKEAVWYLRRAACLPRIRGGGH
jgi:Flp pilus assembly protein TadD